MSQTVKSPPQPAPKSKKVAYVQVHFGVSAPTEAFETGAAAATGGKPVAVPKPVDLTPRITAAKTRLPSFAAQDPEATIGEWAAVKAQYDAAAKLLGAAKPGEPDLMLAEQALDQAGIAKAAALAAVQQRLQAEAQPLRLQSAAARTADPDCTPSEWAPVAAACDVIDSALAGATLGKAALASAAVAASQLPTKAAAAQAAAQLRLVDEAKAITALLPPADAAIEDATPAEWQAALQAVAAVHAAVAGPVLHKGDIVATQAALGLQQKLWNDTRDAVQLRLTAERDALRLKIDAHRGTQAASGANASEWAAVLTACDAAVTALPALPLTAKGLLAAVAKEATIPSVIKAAAQAAQVRLRRGAVALGKQVAPYEAAAAAAEAGNAKDSLAAACAGVRTALAKPRLVAQDLVDAQALADALPVTAAAVLTDAWKKAGVASRDRVNGLVPTEKAQRAAIGAALPIDPEFVARKTHAELPLEPATLANLQTMLAKLNLLTDRACGQLEVYKKMVAARAAAGPASATDLQTAITDARLRSIAASGRDAVRGEARAELANIGTAIAGAGAFDTLAKAKPLAAYMAPLAKLLAKEVAELEARKAPLLEIIEGSKRPSSSMVALDAALADPAKPYLPADAQSADSTYAAWRVTIKAQRDTRMLKEKAITDLIGTLVADAAGGKATAVAPLEVLQALRAEVEKGLLPDTAKKIEADLSKGAYPLSVWRRALADAQAAQAQAAADTVETAKVAVDKAPWVTWAKRLGLTATSDGASSWGFDDTGQVTATRYVEAPVPDPSATVAPDVEPTGIAPGFVAEEVSVQTHVTVRPNDGNKITAAAIVDWILGTGFTGAHVTAEVYGKVDTQDELERKNPKVYLSGQDAYLTTFGKNLSGAQPAGLKAAMEAVLTATFNKTAMTATAQTWLTDGISPERKAERNTARGTYVADLDRRIGELR